MKNHQALLVFVPALNYVKDLLIWNWTGLLLRWVPDMSEEDAKQLVRDAIRWVFYLFRWKSDLTWLLAGLVFSTTWVLAATSTLWWSSPRMMSSISKPSTKPKSRSFSNSTSYLISWQNPTTGWTSREVHIPEGSDCCAHRESPRYQGESSSGGGESGELWGMWPEIYSQLKISSDWPRFLGWG